MTRSAGGARSGARAKGDRSFAERLSPLIAALGVTAVPNLLIRYQKRLQLTSNELVYLLHVLDHHREAGWPWVAISSIVAATGAAERSVRDWRAALAEKGYLELRPRGKLGGGRQPDEHDLSRLFAALEALALEERIQEATDQVRSALPAPTYYQGQLSDVPQLSSAERPGLQTRRARPELGNSAENCRVGGRATMPVSAESTMPVPAGSTMPVSADKKEAVKKRPVKQMQQPTGRIAISNAPVKRTRADDAVGGPTAVGYEPPGNVALATTRAEHLVAALYSGFGADPDTLTGPLRSRELAIARDLIAVGATPDEATAYARAASSETERRAPIDMRSYERERATWRARRNRSASLTTRGHPSAASMSAQVHDELSYGGEVIGREEVPA